MDKPRGGYPARNCHKNPSATARQKKVWLGRSCLAVNLCQSTLRTAPSKINGEQQGRNYRIGGSWESKVFGHAHIVWPVGVVQQRSIPAC